MGPPRTSQLIWVGVGARVTAANPRLQAGVRGCNLRAQPSSPAGLEPGRPARCRVFIAALGMRKAQADGCTCVQQPGCDRPEHPPCSLTSPASGALCCPGAASLSESDTPQPGLSFFSVRYVPELRSHSPVPKWGIGMWSEPVPLVLDHVPFQRSPGPPVLLLWGVRGGSGVFLLLCSPCCPQIPAGAAFAMGLEVLWLLGSLL